MAVGNAASGAAKLVQIAVYTRKSNDENLTGEVTSLDSQKSACRAYINIQKENGWREFPAVFDDPAESGKNLKRPAMKRLLQSIQEGKINGVIVYKLDRLTRNSRDFHMLLELFEKHGVAFISATESIDTKSPQGRLMTAIMVQFAQYDREMDVERSKDFHIARAKKGLWCGGLPPLGYDIKDKFLVLNEGEASLVRRIFDLYIERKSALTVAQEIDRLGFRRKAYQTLEGKGFGGQPFDPDSVVRILQRKVYVGIITNRRSGKEFPGQHKPIISPEAFEAAQKLLSSHNKREVEVVHGANKHGFLLKGLVRCGECRSAVVGYIQSKKKKTYRYYKCLSHVNGMPIRCQFKTIGAQKIEEYLVEKLAAVGYDRSLLEKVVEKARALSQEHLPPLEAEKREIGGRREAVRREIRNLLDLAKDQGASSEAGKELKRLEAVHAELESRLGELEARIAHRKRAIYDVDVIQGTLQRLAHLFYKMPVDLRIRTMRLLLRRVTVFKDRLRAELHELPVADLQRALNIKLDPRLYTVPPFGVARGQTSKASATGRGTALLELSKTGGVDGGNPVKPEDAPLFQTTETDEIGHYFPAFALSWTLNWGRITNGERVIEDLPVGPQLSLLSSDPDETAPVYTTPGVHGRWEQTSKVRPDGALYHAL